MADRKHRAANKAKREYLLSGLIECTECGAKYIGHTSKNSKGYESSCYVCGNKYRSHTCSSRSVKAEELEACVVQNLKMYLLGLNFEKMADKIATAVNSASPDLRSERRELADVTAKINNGMKAILGGFDIPELQTELFRLRVRKDELEDIISRSEQANPVNPDKVIALLQRAVDEFDSDPRSVLRSLVKIYAHPDGSFDISLGVHIGACGGWI